jgi:hypothetical protein
MKMQLNLVQMVFLLKQNMMVKGNEFKFKIINNLIEFKFIKMVMNLNIFQEV